MRKAGVTSLLALALVGLMAVSSLLAVFLAATVDESS
jgi:hypothetical protein